MLSKTLLALTLAASSSAHFILQWPPTAGFVDDDEPTAPCGGATVQVNSSSPQVQVDRFAVSIFSSHPAGSWTFKGTTDTQAPYNWQDLTPVVNTTGPGTFCLSYMHAPEEFAGKAGVIQVTDASVDGMLYQCAPVNFVSGANSTVGSACSNQTQGFQAQWASEDQNNSSDSSSASSSAAPSGSASATSSAAAASSSAAGARAVACGAGLMGGLGAVVVGLVL